MTGVKPADSVLVVGASDGGLAADVALVTGLNGRTVVVDSAAVSQAGVDAAAAKVGALVEFLVAPATALPLDPEGFDVVIVLAASLPELGPPPSPLRAFPATARAGPCGSPSRRARTSA